jgi:hypothetical protein
MEGVQGRFRPHAVEPEETFDARKRYSVLVNHSLVMNCDVKDTNIFRPVAK